MNRLIKQLMLHGVSFSDGVNSEKLALIEETYGISFPQALRDFYRIGVPYFDDCRSDEFPRWGDLSAENTARIRAWMASPAKWLLRDVGYGFWLSSWGTRPSDIDAAKRIATEMIGRSPKLIPIYGHRFMPQLDGISDPPVISTVGRDTILYGANLEDYLSHEFLGIETIGKISMDIPMWTEIIAKV